MAWLGAGGRVAVTLGTLVLLLVFFPTAFSLFEEALRHLDLARILDTIMGLDVVYVPPSIKNTTEYASFNGTVEAARQLSLRLAETLTVPLALAVLVALGIIYTVLEEYVFKR